MRAVVALAVGLALAVVSGGCGEESGGGGGATMRLTIETDDGAGATTRGTLECSPSGASAGGDLAGAAAADLCAKARELKTLLTEQPPKDRPCTQIYGGPQTAHVTGTIDGVAVDRRFSRTNGCEIADWEKAAPLLLP